MVVLAIIIAIVYLLSSMALLSSIIAWISVDFSLELPCALSFAVGTLSLVASFLAVLMVEVARLKRTLGFLFLLVAVVVVMVGVGLVVPFVLSYLDGDERIIGRVCSECEDLGRATPRCVELCNDECCFLNLSEPLILVFVAATGAAIVNSVLGLALGLVHVYCTCCSSEKQH